jgi:hypothetical protein
MIEVMSISPRECPPLRFAVFVSLSVLPGYATESGLNWEIPAAIASALTYSKHSQNKNLVIISGKL